MPTISIGGGEDMQRGGKLRPKASWTLQQSLSPLFLSLSNLPGGYYCFTSGPIWGSKTNPGGDSSTPAALYTSWHLPRRHNLAHLFSIINIVLLPSPRARRRRGGGWRARAREDGEEICQASNVLHTCSSSRSRSSSSVVIIMGTAAR